MRQTVTERTARLRLDSGHMFGRHRIANESRIDLLKQQFKIPDFQFFLIHTRTFLLIAPQRKRMLPSTVLRCCETIV